MSRISKVKICGITGRLDAEAASDAGADAIGLIFTDGKRRISLDEGKHITDMLPPFITPVAVFSGEPFDEVLGTVKYCGIRVVQLHGAEDDRFCRALKIAGPYKIIKTIRVREGGALPDYDSPYIDALLFDAYSESEKGGSGLTFDWDALKGRTFLKPVIIAGGLTPENVGRVVRLFKPYGVDTSSGVEKEPRVKDHAKIIEFVKNAKEVEIVGS